MSYYIKPVDKLTSDRIAVYRVVKRLRDFKPDNGIEYMVFPSKKAMKTAIFVDLYCGKNGKLVKIKDRSMMRF
jgi:uncharacterized iron-regulated membrane protein